VTGPPGVDEEPHVGGGDVPRDHQRARSQLLGSAAGAPECEREIGDAVGIAQPDSHVEVIGGCGRRLD